MKIKFTGAAGTVTGSCHYIEIEDKKILLDCGLFQGKKEVEELNYEELQFNPAEIDYLFLSHSHIDHSGRIPLLVKKGFKGKIYATKPASDLCSIMLMDSAHIQEVEAEWKTRKALRKGEEEVKPLYDTKDAEESLKYFKPILYNQKVEIDENITLRFKDAGHILGSAIIELWIKENSQEEKLVFTGDLGMKNKPILRNPEIIEECDYLIIESTYGNRLHEEVEKRTEKLVDILVDTVKKNGTVVIPSFAVGRTQDIIYELNKYYDGHETETTKILKDIPVFIDSPLATKATEIFNKNPQAFDEEARGYIMKGDNPLFFKNLHFTQSVDESKALNISTEPKIIISASGMCEAGRIRHHLKHNLWRNNAAVVFVGYQADGTLGQRLKDGEKEVKILGEEIKVNAKIYSIEGFSGHGDRDDLISWLKELKSAPKKTFIVHGEEDSRENFAETVKTELGIDTIIPKKDEEFEVTLEKVESLGHEDGRVLFKSLKKIAEEENELVEIEKVHKLKEKLIELKELFNKTTDITDGSLKEELTKKEYNKINNRIIELEKSIVNLTMSSGK
ncbi:MAG: MBL fold metallo-hydrolase [Bacillota bacterium]|nr:MBL fold metallo-hydrolase [Bacillota bacterium]